MKNALRLALLVLACNACQGVKDPNDGDESNHGLITTLVLHFTPTDGGETLSFTWADPELSGSPTIDDIFLPDASDYDHHDAQEYDLSVEVWNELEAPGEDVTPDILAQAEEHQFFFTGSATKSVATGKNSDAIIEQVYADADDGGLPLGVDSTVTTLGWGSGTLTVTLRHMPPEDGSPVKTEGLAESVAEGGFSAIGGGNDIQVSFPIDVE